MVFLLNTCIFCFILSIAKSEYTPEPDDLAIYKHVYLSNMLNDNGVEYKAEYAVDGAKRSCAVNEENLNPSWMVVDLGRQYHIGKVYLRGRTSIFKNKPYEKGELHLLTMNHFDAKSNIPNPSIHNVCWKSGVLERYLRLNVFVNCYSESPSTYQYVVLWAPMGYLTKLCDFQVFEANATNFATDLTTTSAATSSYSIFHTILTFFFVCYIL